jgi:hypothetical protein
MMLIDTDLTKALDLDPSNAQIQKQLQEIEQKLIEQNPVKSTQPLKPQESKPTTQAKQATPQTTPKQTTTTQTTTKQPTTQASTPKQVAVSTQAPKSQESTPQREQARTAQNSEPAVIASQPSQVKKRSNAKLDDTTLQDMFKQVEQSRMTS